VHVARPRGQERDDGSDEEGPVDEPRLGVREGVGRGDGRALQQPGDRPHEPDGGDARAERRVDRHAGEHHERGHDEGDDEQLRELDAEVEPQEGGDERAAVQPQVADERREGQAVDESEAACTTAR
jgi:hypothetical protein